MPNIPIAPTKTVQAVKSVAPTKSIQSTPIKSVTLPSKVALPAKVTYTGVRTLKGGLKVSHTGEVIDNSGDKSQFLPYIASCITCGWQSRVAEKESAELLIKGHVGL